MKINKKLKLKINKFEIEVDDWCIERGFFWLSKGYDSFSVSPEEIKDLKEIIKRFEEKQNETKNNK